MLGEEDQNSRSNWSTHFRSSLVGFLFVRWDCGDGGDVIQGARGVAGVLDQSIEGGFGVFVDGSDRGYEARIEEGFDAGAELLGGLFRGADHVVNHGAAAIVAGGAALGVESRESGLDALGGFRDGEVDVNFRQAAELFESASGGAMQQRAGFRDAGVHLRGGFTCDHACGFHHANKLAVRDAIRGGFKLFGSLPERFIETSARLRLDLVADLLYRFLGFGELALRVGGKPFEALRDLFRLRAVSVVLLFPAALHFAEARLQVTKDFFTGGTHQRFETLLGEFAQLLKIAFANSFDSRKGRIDSFIEVLGERVLHDLFGRGLQFALHGGDELVDGDGHALRL